MTDAAPGVWRVTLRFADAYVAGPLVEHVGGVTTLEGFVRAVQRREIELLEWPWRARTDSAAAIEDPLEWIAANTDANVSFARESHLVQSVAEDAEGQIVARYLFDRVYARAHPEALDVEHLGILHGTIAAKILDDGAVILEREGLAASLRWVATEARGVRLTRSGGRTRGR